MSELDLIMKPYVDSGDYTKEELEKMRKLEYNKLNNTRETSWWKGEEGWIPDELQPGVERSRVKSEEPVKEKPKTEEEGSTESVKEEPKTEEEKEEEENILLNNFPAATYIAPSDNLGQGGQVEMELKREWGADELAEETDKEVKDYLMEKYGTTDRNEIFSKELGDKLYSYEEKTGTYHDDVFGYLQKFDKERLVPIWEDPNVMDYMYRPYLEDYGKTWFEGERIAAGIDDLLGTNWFTTGGEYARDGQEYHAELTDRFYSSYVDRSEIKKNIELDLASNLIGEHEVKYGVGGSLDRTKEAASTYYRGLNKDVYELFESGDFEKAVKLNEENGFVTMYNKDGVLINWEEADVDYSYWEVEGFESEEAYRKHVAENTTVMTIEEEAIAQEYALRRGPEILQKQRRQKAFEVVAALQKLVEGGGMHSVRTSKGFMKSLSFWKDEFNEEDILKAIESGELVPGLTELGTRNQNTETYNKAFSELMVLNRALDLNQDPTFIPEEDLIEILHRPDDFAGMTEDEQVEIAEYLLPEIGLELKPEAADIERAGTKGPSMEIFGRDLSLRDFGEGGRDFVVHIAPLIASIAVTKKLTGPQLTAVSTRLSDILRFGSKSKAWGRFVDFNVAGLKELAVFTGAEQIGAPFGLEPMVFVPGKGGQEESFNPWFAYGLGVGNEMAKRTIMRLRTQWAPGFMSRVNKVPILDKFIQANLGAGGGVGAMELGKLFSGDSEMIKYLDSKIIDNTDYSKYLENGFRSEEEYRAHIVDMHDEAMYGMVNKWVVIILV